MDRLSRSEAVRYLRAVLRELANAKDAEQRRYYRLFDLVLAHMAGEGVIPKERWNQIKSKATVSTPTLILKESSSSADRALISALIDGLMTLISHGYVVPSINRDGYLDLYDLSVTEIGLVWASGEDHVPEDAAGYVAALRGAVPSINRIVERYVIEAIRSYNDGSIFSAAVMLGVASEAALYDLADAVLEALKSERERESLQRAIGYHRMDDVLRTVSAVTKRAAAGPMPYAVHEGVAAHLESLQEAIRVQRNKAGHPTAEEVEPTMVRLGLSAFPTACAKVHQLAAWFRANPASV